MGIGAAGATAIVIEALLLETGSALLLTIGVTALVTLVACGLVARRLLTRNQRSFISVMDLRRR